MVIEHVNSVFCGIDGALVIDVIIFSINRFKRISTHFRADEA